MQQYYIKKQLPEFSSIKDAPKQKKDHFYYNDNFNIWNNRAQTANKNYAFYHQQVDQGLPIIEKMKDREVIDRLMEEEQRKDYILMQKQIDKERLQSRKRERLALQLESMQDIVNKDTNEVSSFIELSANPSHMHSMSINNLVYSKSAAKQNQNPLLGRAPYQWNKLNQTSEKFIKQAINPKIIQKDEEAVHQISNRIEQDRQVEMLKQQSFDKIYAQTRQTFLKQHKKNVEFEKKCGLIPQEKPIVLIQSKINGQTIIPLTKRLVNSSSVKQLVPSAQQMNQNNQNDKRNSIALSSQIEFGLDERNSKTDIYNGITPKNGNQQEELNSARKKLESQQQSSRKSQSQTMQGMLSKNTNDIHKNLQYSTLPYSEETNHPKGDSIVIQYNNMNNQQSKQQVDQINFGDEREQKGNKNRRKSSLAKQSDHSEIPSILKTNVQNMAVNAKSQRVNSVHSIHQMSGQNNKNPRNQIDQYTSEREFLTSAESHNKKQVNFQANIQQVTTHSTSEKNIGNHNLIFVQKNLDDVKQPTDNVKFRKIDELSQPKPKEYLPKEFLERSEYKGLLSTELNNVNVNSDTEFARTMMMNSQIVNSHIYNSQRPSTRQSKISRITQTNTNTFSFVRPSTTASGTRSVIYKNPQNISSTNLDNLELYPPSLSIPYNSCNNSTSNRIHSKKDIHKMNAESTLHIDQKNELLSEIDTFEKKYQFVKENRVGFSKSNLMKFQQKETFMSAKSALGQK